MPTVGVIGGGQLARMMLPAAISMGLELKVFAEADGSPAHNAVTQVGDYNDLAQLKKFAKSVDVITFDHEHVPIDLLEALVQQGVSVQPGPHCLRFAQNKLLMRMRLQELGLPMPAWKAVVNSEQVRDFISEHGPEVVVKTPIGGYDGKGVRMVSDAAEVEDWLADLDKYGGQLLCEQKVSFARELSQLVARNSAGDIVTWNTVQTVQAGGVCAEVIAPAPLPVNSKLADEIARTISEQLGVTGVMAVELFETETGDLLVNELAMRPHNSGHFTIEGAVTSQFEQHLRAVLGLPLGDTSMRAKHAVMLNLLGVDESNTLVENFEAAMSYGPALKIHSYQKQPRKGRKMGHITALGEDYVQLLERCREAAAKLYDSKSA